MGGDLMSNSQGANLGNPNGAGVGSGSEDTTTVGILNLGLLRISPLDRKTEQGN